MNATGIESGAVIIVKLSSTVIELQIVVINIQRAEYTVASSGVLQSKWSTTEYCSGALQSAVVKYYRVLPEIL